MKDSPHYDIIHTKLRAGSQRNCCATLPESAYNPTEKSLQPDREKSSYLQITSVPVAERLNPNENRYILVIQPQGIRAAAGQYTADEAHEIAKATKNWDWSLDANNRPQSLPALEALLSSIVKRSNQGQGVEA